MPGDITGYPLVPCAALFDGLRVQTERADGSKHVWVCKQHDPYVAPRFWAWEDAVPIA